MIHTPPTQHPVTSICVLCGALSELFFQDKGRAYFRCPVCALRFLDPSLHPTPESERAEYLLHENDVHDPRYRKFLSKLADPLMSQLAPGATGLDFGCGPGPALATLMEEHGHPMAIYDPFFAPDPAPLTVIHDFITCSEVAEHFHTPRATFDTLRALVRPGGWLAVMTCFQTDDAKFANWQYRHDPTHVVFYRDVTFEFLAASWGWRCIIPCKDVALLQRPANKPI